ncbi:c-type cytochrome [Parvularcula oceani]|uniref:c-type cytochrome n=1 Tax=Parvularcula oceani TaxID=1247963 RepID=UPI00068F0ADE|nr:cytochrome c [Parvularcula oceani]
MAKSRKGFGMGVGAGIAGLLLLALLIGLITVYSGGYNVAATEPHSPVSRWALNTTMHNAVEARAPGEEDLPPLSVADIAAGAGAYKAMCEHCHGGPGAERADWAEHMLPMPPHLTEAAAEWAPNEMFWILQNGVKMSGMPAFGPSHSDEELLNIVAFVDRLPAMTADEYADLSAQGGHGGEGHEH